MDAAQVRKLLANEAKKAGGAKFLAEQGDMSAAYICDVLAGRREPAGKILDVLGLEKVVTYRKRQAG
jgi:hypothetical protein